MLGDMTPFRLAGNIYFVGTYAASCHAIDTGEGLILIDVGYAETADVVEESLQTLGFDVKDVRMILLSHGHGDHSDGVPQIVKRSGAEVWLFKDDVKYLKGFTPDHYFHDGDVISLGNTKILCLHTPGHTEGTVSFIFDIVENGVTLRAGMFGGAGTNQLKKPFLDRRGLSYSLRGQYFRTLERLRSEHVDVFIGNHSWNNDTRGNYEKSLTSAENPFIGADRWGKFLDQCEQNLEAVIAEEQRSEFVNYAHRGASHYLPENTLLSFYTGVYMGANGIETDIRRARDGTLVLFHDNTLERVTGEQGAAEEYTFEELRRFMVTKDGIGDRIVSFEEFLDKFAFRDLTFAIELKGEGVERDTADLIRRYHIEKKVVVTSFKFDYIRAIKEYAPELRIGLLTVQTDDALRARMQAIGCDEICPKAELLTAEDVHKWHREGFRVRAWGVTDENVMRHACACGVDGMTVNFPDKLREYLAAL